MNAVAGVPNKPFLFLSYASLERELALRVAAALEAAGMPVWIDRTGISAGSAWAGEIVAAVRRCSALVVLCSEAAMHSRNVGQELQLAWDNDRPILPVLLQPIVFPDAMSYFLQGRQWIDATGNGTAGTAGVEIAWLDQLTAALERLGIRPEAPASAFGSERHVDLPMPPGPLIGREREVGELVGRMLGGSRLVTLTGPGGVGKTRLALEVGCRVAGSSTGDAAFIDLSPIAKPELIPSAIAQALGIRESADRSIRDALKMALQDRHLLLVLDNFEQVIEAAPVVGELLTTAPHLLVLVTSREALRVRGEEEVVIEPLALPTEQESADLGALAQSAAVELFVAAATPAKPGFALTEENASAVAGICRRLDGLPLAIELAASRVRHFPPAVLLERLGTRLPVLTGGSRDLPARQQTLRDTIAWSYDLLSPQEQALFRRVGAFPGGATLEALDTFATVAGALDLDLLSGLASLVDKNLVRERMGVGEVPRFSMLETIREFAAEMVDQTGERETSDSAIVAWALEFVSLGKGSALAWFLGPANLQEADDEIDNVRLAFEIAAEQGDAESCARLFVDIYGYLFVRGLFSEAVAMGKQVLELAETSPISDFLRGRTLTGLSYFWTARFDPAEAEPLAREGLALTQRASDEAMHTIDALGAVVLALRDQGRYAEALPYAKEADALASTPDGKPFSGSTKYYIGNLLCLLDDQERAIAYLREAMHLSQGNEFAIYAGNFLANAHLRRDELLEAASTLRLVTRLWQEAGSGANGRPFLDTAALAAASHRPEVAAMLFAVDVAQHESLGMRQDLAPWMVETKEAVRAELGDEAFEAASRAGRKLSLEEATALVLELLDEIEAEVG